MIKKGTVVAFGLWISILAQRSEGAVAIRPFLAASRVHCPNAVAPATIDALHAYLQKPTNAALILESDGFGALKTLPRDSELAQIMVGAVAEQAEGLPPGVAFADYVRQVLDSGDPNLEKNLAVVLRSSLRKTGPTAVALLYSISDRLIADLKKNRIDPDDAEALIEQFSAAGLSEHGRSSAENYRHAVRAIIAAKRFLSEFEQNGRPYYAVAELSEELRRDLKNGGRDAAEGTTGGTESPAERLLSFTLGQDDLRLHEFAAQNLAEILDAETRRHDGALRPLVNLAGRTNSLAAKKIALKKLLQPRYLAPSPETSEDRFDTRSQALLALAAQLDNPKTNASVVSGLLKAAVALYSRDRWDSLGFCKSALWLAAQIAETVNYPWVNYFHREMVVAARKLPPGVGMEFIQPLLDRLPVKTP